MTAVRRVPYVTVDRYRVIVVVAWRPISSIQPVAGNYFTNMRTCAYGGVNRFGRMSRTPVNSIFNYIIIARDVLCRLFCFRPFSYPAGKFIIYTIIFCAQKTQQCAYAAAVYYNNMCRVRMHYKYYNILALPADSGEQTAATLMCTWLHRGNRTKCTRSYRDIILWIVIGCF